MTSQQILALLRQRHVRDVFVPECKNGSSFLARHARLDAWAMRRSFAPWSTFGYEIKVSRSDFTSDRRWPEYLPLCHQFYFVCPAGLIRKNDLPSPMYEAVGILWAEGERLWVHRCAARTDPDLSKITQLMAYVLMSRSRIVRNMHEANAAALTADDVNQAYVAGFDDGKRTPSGERLGGPIKAFQAVGT